MAKTATQEILVPDEVVMSKIYMIRGQKVMLDKDLAEIYGVETKRLKEQVRRNINRFPVRFMFELTRNEYNDVLRSHFATLEQGGYSKYLPFAFSEYGLLMLSNVLKSEQAIQVSIRIIDVFVKLRQILADNTEIRLDIEFIKNTLEKHSRKMDNHDKNIELVFTQLDRLQEKAEQPKSESKSIGFDIGKGNK